MIIGSLFSIRPLIRMAQIGACGLVLVYLGKVWYAYRIFKGMGVKTAKFSFFFGNFPEILRKTHSEALKEWTCQYGKTYGIYEGHLPVLVTSDCEIIQEVFIKQFGNFIARKVACHFQDFQIFADNSPKLDLFLSTKSRWKRMRNIINPTFSPAKLKELAPLMKKCCERFMKFLENQQDTDIVISDFLNRYTMDTIMNCAVGLDIDCLNNPTNPFFTKSLLVFKDLEKLKFMFILTTYLHEFRPFLLELLSLSTLFFSYFQDRFESYVDPLFWLTQKISFLIDTREENKVQRRDFTQLLIESESTDTSIFNDKEKVDINKYRSEKKMSLEEIKFNLVGFLLAGFETTSTSLNYCFYILATHPDEMKRLQEEIDDFYSSHHSSAFEPDIDNVNELNYLDMFIKEALRMYPISSNTVNRRCMYPCKIKDLEFPAGVSVTVDVLSLHYDPEHWGPVDPKVFCPQRFAPEFKRNQMAYLPFGIGPRNCVGMRFALLEMKLALANILKRFDVLPSADLPEKLDYIEGTVRRPKNEIKIQLKKRSI